MWSLLELELFCLFLFLSLFREWGGWRLGRDYERLHCRQIAKKGAHFFPQLTILGKLVDLTKGEVCWKTLEHVTLELLSVLHFYCQFDEAFALHTQDVDKPCETATFYCRYQVVGCVCTCFFMSAFARESAQQTGVCSIDFCSQLFVQVSRFAAVGQKRAHSCFINFKL